MPWNNQGGGGWQGSGQGGPWGGKPGGSGGGGGQGGPGQPPDLEELIRKSQEKVREIFPGGSGGGFSKRAIGLAVLALLLLWLASGFYRVQPEEQGVELRFGRFNEITTPGLNYHLPSPIESVITPQVTRVNRIEIGFRSGRGPSNDLIDEALMLTGDENIVDINFVVLWKINDAASFLFNIRDPEATVVAAAESVMREIIARTPIIEITTEGRRAIEQAAREQLQTLMNDYGAGILIDEVQLQKADPPQDVIEAFRDVQRAQADRERMQNEAEAFANDIIPRARGEAEKMLQQAQGYEQEVVAKANGEAERFKSVLTEYRNAEEVTVKRIYLETMESVLKDMNKIIIDQEAGSGVVPYLPLNELQSQGSRTSSSTSGGGSQ